MKTTRFIISIFGPRYCQFLATCLASIRKHEPNSAVSVYYNDISAETIAKFAKYFREYQFCKTDIPTVMNDTKSRLNTKIEYWYRAMHEHKDNLCFIDVDTILVRPVSDLFEQEFHVALTYCDHPNPKFPMNTGVVFARGGKAKVFFTKWKLRVDKFVANPKKHEKAFKKYGSGDQLSLMETLGEPTSFNDAEFQMKGSIHNYDCMLKCKWLKCSEFNNSEAKSIEPDQRIIHLKSKWHGIILDNIPIESVETRKDSHGILNAYMEYKSSVHDLLSEIGI